MKRLLLFFGVLVCALNVSASEYSEKWSYVSGAAFVTSESGAMMTVACYAGFKGFKLVTEGDGFKNHQAIMKVSSPVTLLFYSVDGAEEEARMAGIFEGAAFIPETMGPGYTNFIKLLKSGNSISIKVHTLRIGETRQHIFTLAGSTAAIQSVDCK